jgi:hypothetical protein
MHAEALVDSVRNDRDATRRSQQGAAHLALRVRGQEDDTIGANEVATLHVTEQLQAETPRPDPVSPPLYAVEREHVLRHDHPRPGHRRGDAPGGEQEVNVAHQRGKPRLLPRDSLEQPVVEHRLVTGLEPWSGRKLVEGFAARPDNDAIDTADVAVTVPEQLDQVGATAPFAEIRRVDADLHGSLRRGRGRRPVTVVVTWPLARPRWSGAPREARWVCRPARS